MAQTIVSVILFLIILGLLPLAIRWYQQRTPRGQSVMMASRVVSTVAVGPQQRVVTVEVGPDDQKAWLVLGVTPQNVQCLHTMAVPPAEPKGMAEPHMEDPA